jgi:arylsulfatase A
MRYPTSRRSSPASPWLVLLVGLAIGLGFPVPACGAVPKVRLPNIVFILADDLGGRDLGCYGSRFIETPHLDRLASQGLRFTRAYAAAPVCSPTRAALLTGQYPARLQMTTWRESSQNPPRDRKLIPPSCRSDLPLNLLTLAELLGSSGYLTAHIGKWHLGDASHFPEAQGFDVHRGGNHWGAPASYFFPYRGAFDQETRYIPHLDLGKEGEYLTDRLTDEAIRVIESAKGRPFFLNLWHYAPHTPLQAKADDLAHFQKKLPPDHAHQSPAYAAMVKNLDENVGRLLHRLDTLGHGRDTLVIFTSDNGGYLGRPGLTVTTNSPLRSGKGSLYEGGVSVPLICRWPGVTPAGTECEAPVISMDLFATLLEAGQVPVERTQGQVADGTSLIPLLKDPSATFARGSLFWHYPHYYNTTTPVGAVLDRDWKLLEYFEEGRIELYHLARDPGESRNMADVLPEKADELRLRLSEWRKQMKAQMPQPNPHPAASP